MATLQNYIRARQRVLLVGPPGIGKTARIEAAAAATNHQVHVLRASLADRIDIGGALVPDASAGVTRELPLEAIHRLQHTTEPTILFLDDLGQAPIDVQAACMRLFDTGYLPENVLIWGATNRPGDKASVVALCEPLRSRFDLAWTLPLPPQPDTAGESRHATPISPPTSELHDWPSELEGWCAWALSQSAEPAIVAWHRMTSGRTLYQWHPDADPAARYPDYRSWHSVIRLMAAGLRDMRTLTAAVGAPVAVEFGAYLALTGRLPAIETIVADPASAAVPASAASLWLLATALGAVMSSCNAKPLLAYIDRMPRVYGALAARDAYRRLGAELACAPAWIAWFMSNQELFT